MQFVDTSKGLHYSALKEILNRDAETLFSPECIVDLRDLPVNMLKHSFRERINSNGQLIDFSQIQALFERVDMDVTDTFKAKYGKFNRFNLGDKRDETLLQYHNHPNFIKALGIMDLSTDNLIRAFRPWWNAVTALQIDFKKEDNHCEVVLTPAHSQETDLRTESVAGLNTSVAALVITRPERGFPDGKLVFGLRGGYNFPNTYMMPAGSLQATPDMIAGTQSIYHFFEKIELRNELGITSDQIRGRNCLGCFLDLSKKLWPHYTFTVRLNLNESELRSVWAGARDREEHRDLVFLANELNAIQDFIRQNYKGTVENRRDRSDTQRALLHIPALALAHYANLPLSLLSELYQRGFH